MKTQDIIKSRKSFGIIFRINEKGNSELLAFRFGTKYKYYRFPGGNIEKNEDHCKGVIRELKEETNLKNLTFMRRIGGVEYFKPFNNKDVRRIDYLFYCHDKTNQTWEYVEKDNKEIYKYKWLKIREYNKIDPELGVFINLYNTPELFIKDNNFGLAKGKLIIKKYNPLWKIFYKYEVYNIMLNINNNDFIYEHIGSTAIEGLHAKPIVDIGIGINKYEDFFPYIKKMENIGYQYKGEYGIPKRHYFVKGEPCFYHVHVLEKKSNEWKKHVKFRNILEVDKKVKGKYNNLKLRLYRNKVNRQKYQGIKAIFIDNIIGH